MFIEIDESVNVEDNKERLPIPGTERTDYRLTFSDHWARGWKTNEDERGKDDI